MDNPNLCDVSPVLETANGLVQGFNRAVEGQSVSSFLAMPFAEPPVGKRRFQYPDPYNRKWAGTRAATQMSATCFQSGSGSEDCLYLNVFTPSKALNISTLLPVMFWIYGGGYTIGDAYFKLPGGAYLYDGSRLAGRHDVVLVTHNYRLNVLGFNTYAKGAHGETGTQAMADQRLAMTWTNKNIQSFGGDPAQVTIFGESAGAFSVIYHLVSPISWPLFSKAIVQSGTSELSWFFQPKDEATDLFEGWAAAVGCPKHFLRNQLECLQDKPAIAFVDAPQNYTGRSPSFPLFPVGPVVDGTEYGLLATPRKLIDANKFAPVPLLVGSNKDGGSLFEPMLASIIPGVHAEALVKNDVELIADWAFYKSNRSAIETTYSPAEFSSVGILRYQRLVARVMRDLGFLCSNRRMASAWRARGLASYMYVFSFDFGHLEKLTTLGDFHGADIVFIFRALLWIPELLPNSTAVQKLADIMSCQWASFAYAGNPNGVSGMPAPRNCQQIYKSVAPWPVYDDARKYYSLQATKTTGPKVGALRADNIFPDDEFASDTRCDMWDTVGYPWHSSPAVAPAASSSLVV